MGHVKNVHAYVMNQIKFYWQQSLNLLLTWIGNVHFHGPNIFKVVTCMRFVYDTIDVIDLEDYNKL